MECIVGQGGSQTRSLREVYWFIEGQLNILCFNKSKYHNLYFANILDGDNAGFNMDKFHYLLSLEQFKSVNKKIFVGDLRGYIQWFQELNKNDFDN